MGLLTMRPAGFSSSSANKGGGAFGQGSPRTEFGGGQGGVARCA